MAFTASHCFAERHVVREKVLCCPRCRHPGDVVGRGAGDVFGMAESPSGTWTLDDTLPYFGMLINPDAGVTTSITPFEFENCMISDWQIQGRAPRFNEDSEPEMILLTISIIGSTVNTGTAWPGTPPTLPYAAVDAPYIMSDAETSGASTVTLNGAVRWIQAFIFKVDMGTYVKYVNTLTAHSLRATKRDITAAFQLPLNSDNDDLYGQAVAGAAASIKLTNGDFSSTFNFGRFQVPNNTPVVRGKTEVPLNIQGIVAGTGATPDLVLVNDITP